LVHNLPSFPRGRDYELVVVFDVEWEKTQQRLLSEIRFVFELAKRNLFLIDDHDEKSYRLLLLLVLTGGLQKAASNTAP
jgi:hypothetical protein